jgi:hypothetical protein
MSGERPEYRALRAIPDPANPTRSAYHEGDLVFLQVVEDWGLEVGADVESARRDSISRPAGNASRADWARYAEIQGIPQDEVDGMTRDQLRDDPRMADPASTTDAEED